MNIAEMSVAYKLQSNDFQVFYDNRKACFIWQKMYVSTVMQIGPTQ